MPSLPKSSIAWILIGLAISLLYTLVALRLGPSGQTPVAVVNPHAHAGAENGMHPVVGGEAPKTSLEALPSLKLKKKHLKAFRGQTPKTPIYIAVRGLVYDVSAGSSFYGPGGAYSAFAGTDATLGLAKGQIALADQPADIAAFSQRDMESLEEWEEKFRKKYPVVARLADG